MGVSEYESVLEVLEICISTTPHLSNTPAFSSITHSDSAER